MAVERFVRLYTIPDAYIFSSRILNAGWVSKEITMHTLPAIHIAETDASFARACEDSENMTAHTVCPSR